MKTKTKYQNQKYSESLCNLQVRKNQHQEVREKILYTITWFLTFVC